ncbi:hypothetical protein SEA_DISMALSTRESSOR_73 [Mycobacterium phage DismalStressor]|nr:hypothetical protein SEA_DISMALFUNK_73 [Mycobacterium phage DismalFunk]AYB69047.1 hypothetical protein SEA_DISMALSTRESSOR_73 [Mycobacterium phage DismalStressor]
MTTRRPPHGGASKRGAAGTDPTLSDPALAYERRPSHATGTDAGTAKGRQKGRWFSPVFAAQDTSGTVRDGKNQQPRTARVFWGVSPRFAPSFSRIGAHMRVTVPAVPVSSSSKSADAPRGGPRLPRAHRRGPDTARNWIGDR